MAQAEETITVADLVKTIRHALSTGDLVTAEAANGTDTVTHHRRT